MTTQIVTLTRSFQNDKVTMGALRVNGVQHDPIYTLENPWKGNKPYISCIPADSYVCRPFTGSKFKRVYALDGVVDRSAILIHVGNVEEDTSGCILIGLAAGELNGEPAVLNSRAAMKCLKRLLGTDQFILTIKEP